MPKEGDLQRGVQAEGLSTDSGPLGQEGPQGLATGEQWKFPHGLGP